MTTKIPAELSSTPGIVDNSNATAITIGSDETTTFANEVIVQEATSPTLKLDTTSAATSAATLNLEGYRTTGDIGALVKINAINARDGDTHASLYIYASGDTNGYFQFNNTASTQIARLDTDGLKFGTDTATANALDDYEEGTFTPTVTSGITSVGYSAQTGYYTRIGNLVLFNLRVVTSSGNAQSSTFAVGNLPFNSAATQQPGGAAIRAYASSFSGSASQAFIGPASNSISFFTLSGTAFAGTSITDHDGFDLRITGIYRA